MHRYGMENNNPFSSRRLVVLNQASKFRADINMFGTTYSETIYLNWTLFGDTVRGIQLHTRNTYCR